MSKYEGPTGVMGVLYDVAAREKIPTLSLWATAPHYIASATNPKVALGLLDGLERTLGWQLDLSVLRDEVREFELEVNAIIQANPDAAAYVTRLEEASREGSRDVDSPPPTDALVSELEAYLRRRRGESNSEDAKSISSAAVKCQL